MYKRQATTTTTTSTTMSPSLSFGGVVLPVDKYFTTTTTGTTMLHRERSHSDHDADGSNFRFVTIVTFPGAGSFGLSFWSTVEPVAVCGT